MAIDQKEKQRKLSAAETRRLQRFEQVSEELTAKGYKKTELTVGIVKANVFAILLALPVCVLGIYLFVKMNPGILPVAVGMDSILMIIAYLVLIPVHELIHGITWSFFAKNGMKDIEFGFMKEYLTPYCTCAAPLTKYGHMTGTVMPLIILGILPLVISWMTGSALLLWIGLLMTVSAGGDILIILLLLKHKSSSAQQLVYDHPTQAGSVVFER